ncbi:hypothetical protein [Ureibacillus sp. FSL E2-3493]|uniref:hypothetical protein n=1 Tax=Ureibacillus sp. FSL E2-3493 TaxID=2921367 RepID=UPI003119FE39
MILGGIFAFTIHPYAKKSIPSATDTNKLFENIQNELQYKYDIGASSIASNPDYTSNEIIIPINGSKRYYDSVKDEVKSIVKNIIKSTPFENYSIKIEKNKIEQFLNEEDKEKQGSLFEITKTIHESLSESYPNQIGDINITESTPNLIIEVHTLIKEQEISLSKEIESKINRILNEKLSSNLLVKESSVNIHIYNNEEKRIN